MIDPNQNKSDLQDNMDPIYKNGVKTKMMQHL